MNAKCKCVLILVLLALQVLAVIAFAAESAAPMANFARLSVKEITVFKDGHAFVAHEGPMPTDERGNVVMDYLPTPVLGTFWPYAAEESVQLTSVVAGQKRVLVERTALTLRELLEANVGAGIIVSEGGNRYEATIAGFPARSAEELARTSPPNTGERLPEHGSLILLKTFEGIKAVPIDSIQQVVFQKPPRTEVATQEFRNLLTLNLNWKKPNSAKTVNAGLIYLQKGIRWIPNYKVEIGNDGKALIKLQATLINELVDLEGVAVNLVIGVPTFAFKDTTDPMALQQTLAQLSPYFRNDAGVGGNFSNAMMAQTQVARMGEYRGAAQPGETASLGPEIGDSTRTEDLFVFNVQRVTLKKGERMVLPIAEFALPATNVYTLELPFGPPPEARRNFNTEQQRELALLLNAPKVTHKIRLTNNSKYPLTTAPALILREGRVLAQSMMTYTLSGADVDIPITTAIDFQVKKSDFETGRASNAIEENGNRYSRIDLKGKITLTSHRTEPAEIEVTRYVLGAADTASHEGLVEKLNAFEDNDYLLSGSHPWWNWYSWPSWWNYFNGIGRVTWKLKLEPRTPTDLEYTWHYFWR
jgi:hypothetical protein